MPVEDRRVHEAGSRLGAPTSLRGREEEDPQGVLRGSVGGRQGQTPSPHYEGQITTVRQRVEGRKALADHRVDVEAEIRRLGARGAIEAGRRATDTSTITKKCTTLTRPHVTSLVRDQFTHETDRLYLEHVTLNDLGGQKGSCATSLHFSEPG